MLVIIFCKIKTLNKNSCLKQGINRRVMACCNNQRDACATDPGDSGSFFIKIQLLLTRNYTCEQ